MHKLRIEALSLFFFLCVIFSVLFSCVDKSREQKESGRVRVEGLNSRASAAQMFTIPTAM